MSKHIAHHIAFQDNKIVWLCGCNPADLREGKRIEDTFLRKAALTPEQWLTTEYFKHIQIIDPDGWDRANFETAWKKPITKKEMWDRVMKSTVSLKKATTSTGDQSAGEAQGSTIKT